MRDVADVVQAWTAAGSSVALGTVVGVRRSAPRPPGAKMAVSSTGEIHGAVSGGCVEGAVIAAAEQVLRGAPAQLLHFGIADEEAWDVGLPCGGEIDVWVERFGSPEQDAFLQLAHDGGRGALVTDVESGRRLLVGDGHVTGSLGAPEQDDRAQRLAEAAMWAEQSEMRDGLFVDAVFPAPRLIIFGAIDFAAVLCSLARLAGWRPYVVDPRSRFATRERFPDAVDVIAAWPAEACAELGGIDRATSIAVLSHDPKLDDAALELSLRSDAAYVGAMGSRRAQEQRRERLLARGLTDDELARLAAPIGLDLGAVTPEETALSIISEIVAARRGHPGGRLRDARGRIHEVGA